MTSGLLRTSFSTACTASRTAWPTASFTASATAPFSASLRPSSVLSRRLICSDRLGRFLLLSRCIVAFIVFSFQGLSCSVVRYVGSLPFFTAVPARFLHRLGYPRKCWGFLRARSRQWISRFKRGRRSVRIEEAHRRTAIADGIGKRGEFRGNSRQTQSHGGSRTANICDTSGNHANGGGRQGASFARPPPQPQRGNVHASRDCRCHTISGFCGFLRVRPRIH